MLKQGATGPMVVKVAETQREKEMKKKVSTKTQICT